MAFYGLLYSLVAPKRRQAQPRQSRQTIRTKLRVLGVVNVPFANPRASQRFPTKCHALLLLLFGLAA